MDRFSAAVLLAGLCLVRATVLPQSGASDDALARSQLERARDNYEKIKLLVAEGTLPRAKQTEAGEQVADAEDNLTLAQTLYRQLRVEDMTAAEASAMTEAAQRRVDRQAKLVDSEQGLVEAGVLARSDGEALQAELADRQRVLVLARNRASLLADLAKMAEAERRLQDARSTAIIRFDGSGEFELRQLGTIERRYRLHFGHALPVSALGQTSVHQAMGLDHRGRVDVALSPDSPEGRWLRQLLEGLGIPYLAFRSALAGAATAPHIHIGLGSHRLPAA